MAKTRTQNTIKRAIAMMALFGVCTLSYAQRIVQIEYFLDKEPGVGKGNSVSFSGPSDSVLKTLDISTSGLSSGQHFIYVRIKDSAGLWTPWQMQLFLVQDTINIGVIDKVEYFIGRDPGVFNGNNQTITKGDTVETVINKSTGNLSMGQNFVHVRAKTSNGYWSPWQVQLFLVADTTDIGKITNKEYFFDTDPGVGQGTAITLSPADTVFSDISIKSVSLNPGRHFLHTRAKLASGYWSPWQFQIILVDDTIQPGPIDKIEYFINKDPGLDKGTKVSITPADTVNKLIQYNTSSLNLGRNYFHVRSKNSNGFWSPWQFQMFIIQEDMDNGKIVSYKNSIDSSLNKPAYVKTNLISPSSDSIVKIHFEKTDTALQFKQHFFRIWAQQNNRLSSTWHFDTFFVIDCPMLDTAAIIKTGKLCLSDTAIFIQDITKFGIWSKDSFNFKWSVNGTQLSTADSFKYRHNNGDSFHLKFAFSRKSDARCKGDLESTILLFKSPKDTMYQGICEGDSLLVHGLYRKVSDTFNYTGTSSTGCDSFSAVILTVHPKFDTSFSRNICSGDSIKIHGSFKKQNGTYILNGNSVYGCDSIVAIQLIVNPVFIKADTFVICNGDTLKIHGKNYTSAGTYSDSFKTTKGCDSIFTTRVIVNPIYNDSSKRSICSGDSSLIHGVWRKAAGSYRLNGTTTKGCDSFSTVQLIIKPVYNTSNALEICAGDSISIHGVFRKSAGTYVLNGKTTLGCDSAVTVSLKVNPVYRKTDTLAICNGDTLKIHGKNYTSAGTYSDSFKTTKGCDSIFTTRVIVNPVYNDSNTRSICSGDSSLIHGVWRKAAGSYRLNGTTTKGCDSFSTVQLIIKPVYNTSNALEICAGDSIMIHGVFRKSTGIFILNGKTTLGCDSVVSVALKVNPVFRKTDTFEICNGDTLRVHGKRYAAGGTYLDSFKTAKGCDSLFTTRLIVHPTYNLSQSRGLCGGDSFFFAGVWRKVTGTFVGKFNSTRGCDSTVTLKLTVDSIIQTDDFPEICLGDSIFIGGVWRHTSGIYTDSYKAFKGCDSLVFRHLSIIQRDTTYIQTTICQRSSFNFHGQILSDTGIYKAILKNAKGCDSVVFIRVFKYSENRTIFSGHVCFGEGFFAGKSMKFGTGTFFDTLIDHRGCDSVVIYTQTERPRDTFAADFSICFGDSVFTGQSWKKTNGVYIDTLLNRFGCDSILTTRIEVRPVSFFQLHDTICFGDSYNFFGTQLTEPGSYQKILVNHRNCDSIINLELFKRPQYIPKVVTSGFALLSTERPYQTYQWYLNRIILPLETNRTIQVKSNGIYDVTVSDSLGCFANSWDDLASANLLEAEYIVIYPNPTSETLNIRTAGISNIIVYNTAGKNVFGSTLTKGINQIQISTWPEGMYQVIILQSNRVYSAKFIVIH